MSELRERTELRVEPAAGSLGAYVHGMQLAQLDQAGRDKVRELMRTFHVVCFREQELTPDQHVEFTRTTFGEIYRQPIVSGFKDNPDIVEVFGAAPLTERWHQDSTHSERPPRFSVLVARTLPPYGNDTQFSNQHLAYDALSPGLKKMLDGVRVIHRSKAVAMQSDAKYAGYGLTQEEAAQPVVRTHPETGRKALYINAMYGEHFEDMTPEESRGLFEYLCTHCGRPDFTFRHRWQPGDVLIWDNASVQHAVVGDMPTGTGRYLHRTTTIGERPY